MTPRCMSPRSRFTRESIQMAILLTQRVRLGGRGGVNDDKNGDPGLPDVRQDAICADSRALVVPSRKKLNVAPTVRHTIRLPHIYLIGSTSRIHPLNGRTERYFLPCRIFGSWRESECSEVLGKRSLASVTTTPEKTWVRIRRA